MLKPLVDLLLKPRRAARKLMVSAVDSELKPRIRELGFSSAQTRAWRSSEFHAWLSGWGWIRMRDGRVDLLSIYWDKYGRPKFQIQFSSQSMEAWQAMCWGESHSFGQALAGGRRRPNLHWFVGRPEKTIERASLRLAELDRYLRDGEQSPTILDRAAAGRAASSSH